MVGMGLGGVCSGRFICHLAGFFLARDLFVFYGVEGWCVWSKRVLRFVGYACIRVVKFYVGSFVRSVRCLLVGLL